MALYRDDYCTCRARAVRSDDIDPPEIKRDRNCPIHGVDPDELRDRKEDAGKRIRAALTGEKP